VLVTEYDQAKAEFKEEYQRVAEKHLSVSGGIKKQLQLKGQSGEEGDADAGEDEGEGDSAEIECAVGEKEEEDVPLTFPARKKKSISSKCKGGPASDTKAGANVEPKSSSQGTSSASSGSPAKLRNVVFIPPPNVDGNIVVAPGRAGAVRGRDVNQVPGKDGDENSAEVFAVADISTAAATKS